MYQVMFQELIGIREGWLERTTLKARLQIAMLQAVFWDTEVQVVWWEPMKKKEP